MTTAPITFGPISFPPPSIWPVEATLHADTCHHFGGAGVIRMVFARALRPDFAITRVDLLAGRIHAFRIADNDPTIATLSDKALRDIKDFDRLMENWLPGDPIPESIRLVRHGKSHFTTPEERP